MTVRGISQRRIFTEKGCGDHPVGLVLCGQASVGELEAVCCLAWTSEEIRHGDEGQEFEMLLDLANTVQKTTIRLYTGVWTFVELLAKNEREQQKNLTSSHL